MPGCDVTVTVAFTATPDRQAVESAQSLITSATFTVLQSDANTQDDVRNWLAMQINSLVGSTGVNTVTSPDITIGSFTAATAGTPSGTNGSFTFTVALAKGSSSLITPSKSGTITATALNAPTYTVTVVPSTNGSATVSPSGAVAEGATMTLTLAPSTDYEPASLRIYRTGVPSTPVPFTGSGNTRIFQMPGYNVTVEATFQPTSQFSDQQDVDNARSLIESATFNILQVTANSPDDVRSWLTQEINSLIGSTGVMALASGITVSNFMAAIAGTADLPSGTNGSFTFTVALGKNSATATTSARTGRIIATAYTPPAQYGITVRASSNGSVTANAASAPEGATVTLTLAPEEGYEPDHVSVYRSASATPLALAGTGLTRTFTMPGYGVTVEATFRKTQEQIDEETVEEAKDMIEGGTYRIAQATGNTATTVSAWVANVLNLLLSGQNAVITLRSAEPEALAADVTLTELVPAVEGTEVNPAGVNGSFRFIVVLTKGNVHIQTLEIDGVIVAMPYAATPVKRIELLPIGEMRVRIINTGNTATGNLTVTLSGANAQAFTLSSAAPGSLATGGETDILLIPADGLPTGVYTATMTVSGEGITPVSVDITYRVSPTGNAAFAASCVWAAGNTLYIAAATAGEARIFSIGGQLVKIVSHTAGETVKTLLQQGLYIVVAEGETYKITVR
jgi:hypothetical protein